MEYKKKKKISFRGTQGAYLVGCFVTILLLSVLFLSGRYKLDDSVLRIIAIALIIFSVTFLICLLIFPDKDKRRKVNSKDFLGALYSGLVSINLFWLIYSFISDGRIVDTSSKMLVTLAMLFVFYVLFVAFAYTRTTVKKRTPIYKAGLGSAMSWGLIFVCFVWLVSALLSQSKIIDTSAQMLIILAVIYIVWILAISFIQKQIAKKKN